jgi:hypothetical protein
VSAPRALEERVLPIREARSFRKPPYIQVLGAAARHIDARAVLCGSCLRRRLLAEAQRKLFA